MQSDDRAACPACGRTTICACDTTSRFESRFPSTEAIVQEQTVRRLNDAYNEEQRRKREAVRAAITVILCVGAILGGFLVCKMMGWGEP